MSDNINPDHYKRLPVEAIEIIESAIEGAPTSQEAYLQGQALKYLLRANHKNGREDIHKAKWYLDRMVASFTVPSNLLDHPSSPTKPPDGWRWLRMGEPIRNGDKPKNGDAVPLLWIGTPCCNNQFILRRNKFEVGEKVVHGDCKSLSISVVENILDDGWVDLVRDGVSTAYHVKDLAPYIEDAT